MVMKMMMMIMKVKVMMKQKKSGQVFFGDLLSVLFLFQIMLSLKRASRLIDFKS